MTGALTTGESQRTDMKIIDAALRVIRWILIWTCIPALAWSAFIAKELIQSSEKKSVQYEKRLSESELKLNDLEWKIFRMADDLDKADGKIKAAKKEVIALADKILDVCVTDAPRPLKKKKGRK